MLITAIKQASLNAQKVKTGKVSSKSVIQPLENNSGLMNKNVADASKALAFGGFPRIKTGGYKVYSRSEQLNILDEANRTIDKVKGPLVYTGKRVMGAFVTFRYSGVELKNATESIGKAIKNTLPAYLSDLKNYNALIMAGKKINKTSLQNSNSKLVDAYFDFSKAFQKDINESNVSKDTKDIVKSYFDAIDRKFKNGEKVSMNKTRERLEASTGKVRKETLAILDVLETTEKLFNRQGIPKYSDLKAFSKAVKRLSQKAYEKDHMNMAADNIEQAFTKTLYAFPGDYPIMDTKRFIKKYVNVLQSNVV